MLPRRTISPTNPAYPYCSLWLRSIYEEEVFFDMHNAENEKAITIQVLSAATLDFLIHRALAAARAGHKLGVLDLAHHLKVRLADRL